MNKNLTQPGKSRIYNKASQFVDLRTIINRYFFHWPLFVISLLLAATCAFIFVQIVRPVHEIRASLVIKDDKKTPDQESALREIDLLNSTKIVENEVEILSSKKLVSQVVEDLQLQIRYEQTDGLLPEELYKFGPVKLVLVKPSSSPKELETSGPWELTVIVKDNSSFLLKMPDGNPKEFRFKNTYVSNFGKWKLEPTEKLLSYKGATIKITLDDPEKVALDYQKSIDVTLPDKLSSAVTLSLDDRIPQRGKDILNDLVLNYNLAATAEKRRQTKNTIDFIDQRLDSLARELNGVEKGIETFKSSRGLTDISSQSQISLQNMQANDKNLNDVNVQLSVIDGIERYINSSQNLGRAPSTQGITDPALIGLIEKLSDLELEREKLLASTPETNPDFETIDRQIATTKSAIKGNVKSIKSSLLNTREKLQSYNSGFKSSIKNIPTQERQYIGIKRELDVKEGLYTYLLQQREEISVNYASTLADGRIIDEAYSSPVKISKIILPFAVALFLGMAIPAGLIYGRNVGKILDSEEITNSITGPIIGELSFASSKKPIAINYDEPTLISEQFRVVRVKLNNLLNERKKGRVILITSSVPKEGKSFIASNLGAIFAISGRKTIILDLDLRRPKLAEIFGLTKKHFGISDFLNGRATMEEIILSSDTDTNLDFIIGGSGIKNPSELLERAQLADLISSLREIYDDIIIDSPPVRLTPDALILSVLVDISIYIVRQGFTKKVELGFISELYNQQELPEMNILFNGIRRIKYGYGYSFDKSYYNSKKSMPLATVFENFSERF